MPQFAGLGIDIWHGTGPPAHFSKRFISLHPGGVREIEIGGRVHRIDGSASLRDRATGSTACYATGRVTDTLAKSGHDAHVVPTRGSASGDQRTPVPLQQVWVVVSGMMARCLTNPTMTIEWWLDLFANKVASCSVIAHRNVTGIPVCGTYREVMSERTSSRRKRLPVNSGKSLGSGSNHRNLNRLLMSKGQTSEWMSG